MLKVIGVILIAIAMIIAFVKRVWLGKPSGVVNASLTSKARQYWEDFPMYEVAVAVLIIGFVSLML